MNRNEEAISLEHRGRGKTLLIFPIRDLFTKWELYHTTASVDQHFSMLEELRNRGIDFKTKGLNFGGGYGGASGFSTVYHIYVRKEEE